MNPTIPNYHLYKEAIRLWSASAQVGMLHEEMAELTIAINKFDRGKDTVEHITEEIADVRIMLEQMQALFMITDESLKRVYDLKIEKMKKMLQKGEL